ncbi:MAG: cytochrome c oxidase subunit II [Solirubrobacteraceae bacterium]
MRRHPLAHMLAIAAVASAGGIALALAIDWFPQSAATRALKVDREFDVLLIVSVPIFVLIQTVVLYSVWRFRMRPGEELKDGPPTHGNTPLEVLWTAVPGILIASLVTYAFVVLDDIERRQPRALSVNVIAQQFAWNFDYPRPSGEPVRSTVLYLPQGRPVEFRVRSLDVVHSFFVPAFRAKIDAVPGITTDLRVTPTRRGRYPVLCAELCGLGHAVMRASVVVLAPNEFQAWLAKQSRDATGNA